MRSALYFDPCSGAAGDMINAALIDAGADFAAIASAIASVGVADLHVRIEPVMQGPLAALRFIVEADPGAQPDHLGPTAIIELIQRATVAAVIKERAAAIVARIADAEAAVHRVPRDQVHFHELGGLDTVADVLGACVALATLGDPLAFVGPLPLNGGTWGMRHGWLPLPAPATLAILAAGALEVIAAPSIIPRDTELVTPTGAAILAEVARPGLPRLRLARIGYGAGTRDLPVPNVLRVWTGLLHGVAAKGRDVTRASPGGTDR